MQYDFDTVINRRNTGSLKWDVGKDELPMWVADMDFACSPEILSRLTSRLSHPVFGYTQPDDEWRTSYAEWWKKRHGLFLDEKRLLFCSGVVPAISSLVRRLSHAGENVVLLTPVYNIFFNSVLNNGRKALECPLVYDKKDHSYNIDFPLLEKLLSLPETSLLLLCNPHNPVGRVWSPEELSKIGFLCKKNFVTVISDEIHCDIVFSPKKYTPFALSGDDSKNVSVTCFSPTKTFNLAGIQTSAVYAPNERLFNQVFRSLNNDEIAEPNVLACETAIASFSYGEPWLKEALSYIEKNRRYSKEYIEKNLPLFSLTSSFATYLLWIDISSLTDMTGKEFCDLLRCKTGLILSDGNQFGRGGEHFVRMNIACPKTLLDDGLNRLSSFYQSFL